MARVWVCNGHGGWSQKDGIFIVPANMQIHFMSEHGKPAYTSETFNKRVMRRSKEITQGKDNNDNFIEAFKASKYCKQTIDSGGTCFNYHMSDTKGLGRMKGAHKKLVRNSNDTYLSQIAASAAKKNIQHLIWYSCRSLMNLPRDSLFGCLTAKQAHEVAVLAATDKDPVEEFSSIVSNLTEKEGLDILERVLSRKD